MVQERKGIFCCFQKKTTVEKVTPEKTIVTSERPTTQNPIDLIKEDLFYDILEKQFGKCTITEFRVKKSSGGGENYMSCMFCVTIGIEKKDGTAVLSDYIVKLMPPNDPQAEFKKIVRAFPKEVEMYEKIVPQFEQVFREIGIEATFAPKCWKTLDDPQLIIMEDLHSRKFKNIDRLKGMDMQHTEIVLKKLAQFHAASAYIFEKSGPYSDQLQTFFADGPRKEEFKVMMKMQWVDQCEIMRLWGTCQEYIDQLESLADRIDDLRQDALRVDHDEFNVILHGDLWANNIMFQHDENGQPKEVLFVDLQFSRYASPVQDLMYFIFSSTDISIKVNEFHNLIRFYHRELVKNLTLLKYPKPLPTLMDLNVALLKRSFYGISVCTTVMPVALIEHRDDATIENFFEDTEAANKFKQEMLTNPRLIKSCEIIFPFLSNKGAFDV